MTKNNKLTPDGTSDRLFEACEAETKITGRISGVFEEAGYRKVRTPGLEFLSAFASSASYYPPEEMYKLSDSEGRLIAVRPDSTIPIARLVATKLKGAGLPLKLYYAQSVYRRQPEHKGLDSEVMQMGVELVGEAGFTADVDMIDLALQSLEASYENRFRIEIGHVGLYKRLIERLGADEEIRNRINRYVNSKNYSALEDVLFGFEDRRTAGLLLRLPGLFGGTEALATARALFEGYDETVCGMIGYLARVMEELAARGYAGRVMVDLGLVGRSEYYSSLVFKGYGEGVGEPLLSGGRYDELLCDFGEDMPATGFGMNIDLLTEAALGKKPEASESKARPLRIALTKGRLEEEFVSLMERAGYDMMPLKEKGRKLIISIPGGSDEIGGSGGAGGAGGSGDADGLDGSGKIGELGDADGSSGRLGGSDEIGGSGDADGSGDERDAIELFLAKATDVVTSVEHGACDIGIVGKDTLLEQGGTYYEIMDLDFGKCRFALAAPSGGAVANGEPPRVAASKYPQYASRYFERLGLDVRIIHIEGSVEIAPLIGLSDSIVDIVQTGTTLRENGLEVVTYIRDISARLIVNVTGMKLRKREVEAFAAALGKAAGTLSTIDG